MTLIRWPLLAGFLSRGSTDSMAEVQGFEEHLASAQTQDSAKSRFNRRLSDKILLAFHAACDQGDYEIAEQLLRVLEKMRSRRKNIENLVAAHERLWHFNRKGLSHI